MVSIARDKNHIVEFPECSKLISLKSKPYIHSFLHYLCLSVSLYLTKMLIMEDHIIFYQCILKFSFII